MLHQLLLYIIDEPTCGNDQPATSPQEASLNESPTFLSFAIGLKSVVITVRHMERAITEDLSSR